MNNMESVLQAEINKIYNLDVFDFLNTKVTDNSIDLAVIVDCVQKFGILVAIDTRIKSTEKYKKCHI